jgi:ParB family chromosome partitioning protein
MPEKTPSLFAFDDDDQLDQSKSSTSAGDDERRQTRLRLVKLKQIEPDPDHPRQIIAEEDISALATSIKQYGIQQPIIVRRIPGSYDYVIIDGVIRFRAAQRCGLEEIPAHVVVCRDPRLVYVLMDLTHRELHPVDLAENIEKATTSWSGSDGDLAKVLGKQQSVISRSRRIATLSAPVKAAMRQQEMSFSVAHELADDTFTDGVRLDLLTKNSGKLTTDRLRAEIRRRQRKPASSSEIAAAEVQLRALRRLATWLRRNGEPGEPLDLTLRDAEQRIDTVIRGSSGTSS